ncbi:hypothetical protein TH25_15290 [Thalassospira profundimaris]|uniref:Uncharacterized protein n=1 Tax=Thalassospira profundimaris TaxID=502049 RepID=A0A367X1U3_9PROT|nr:hypothetical protein [Thalassospira profundimaris]RCK47645.1 hypothetical protein TH25_15290 [Thalassospira profundimaris]
MTGEPAGQNPETRDKKLPNGHYFKIMGYLLTACWVGYIVMITQGDTSHPMFDYIFSVPLVCWIVGMVIAHFIRKKAGGDRP